MRSECPTCNGSGTISLTYSCPVCSGTGGSMGNPDPADNWVCPECNGAGTLTAYYECATCGGSGEV